jgi:ketosteroid isomerase-like protein
MMANNRSEIEHQAAIERTQLAVGRYASAWLAGDRAALAACYHDDFTLHYFGRNPLAGDHTGKAAALGVLAEVTRRTNRKLLAIVDVMAGPERGALLVRERFERDGRTAEVERLLVYAVHDGLLSECWSTTRTRRRSMPFWRKTRSDSLPDRFRLSRWNRHRGDTDDDAGKADPGGRTQLLAEENHAHRNADRHAQIGLRGGADRSQRLD